MNSSFILRFLSKSSRFHIKHGHHSRSLQHFNCAKMSTNVSVPRSDRERETFQDELPGIIESIVRSPKFVEVPAVTSWIKQIMDYNLAGGKKTRGLTTVLAYEMLDRPENITDETLKLARVMGWCVEMLQAYLLVADDIMDGSTTRRGVPCWYRLSDVGMGAVNDSILIYTSIMHILKTHFSSKPLYTDMIELFNETLLFTAIGQHLDFTMAHRNKNDYSLFTIECYNAIAKYKTSYYSYKLPVCLGLLLANIKDPESHQRTEEICFDIGELFQIQDDYIDCFGDEAVTGKAGTDIQEGKCSWFAVQALKRFNEEQRDMFVKSYGSKDPNDVSKIKRLYNDLDLLKIYSEYEKNQYNYILKKANALARDTKGVSPSLFLKLLDMIYNRKQ